MKRLAIITTHPIQYNAPWFRLLAERRKIAVKVFYTWSQVEKEEKFDPGFGKVVAWNIPLLEGYDYTFVGNTSKNPGSKSYSGIINPGLVDEVSAWNPDAVLFFGWKFKSHLQAMLYFKKKILVLFRGDSTLLNESRGVRSLLRAALLRRVYKNVDQALYVGTENKKYFLKAGLAEKQLVFVPHAVDNDRFAPTTDTLQSGARFRNQLNIGADDLVFLFAGKFEAVKNPQLMLQAAKEISLTNVHFVFAGNGPLESEMKQAASEGIHFLDFQNQAAMPGLYQACDVFVLPSISETWGLAVNEAMAAGKPVLVSEKCGCAADLVTVGVTGYVFRSNDVSDLKNKLVQMAADKAHLREMGSNASQKIKDWSFEGIVSAVEALVISAAHRWSLRVVAKQSH